ncbi:MAG: calcium-binding protein [Methylobacter sp.]
MLYSGLVGNNVHSGAVAQALADANPGKILTINQTEVFELLNSKNFTDALQASLGPKSQARDQIYDTLINGSKDANGIRIPDSLWDDASQRFAASATGEVRTITPFADSTRVFAQTEVASLLNNPNVTHIDGYPKDYFLRMKADAIEQGLSETQALERVQSTVSAISLERTSTLQFSLDAQDNIARDAIGNLQPIGTAGFFNGTSVVGSNLADTSAHTFGGNIMAGAMQSGQIPNTYIDSFTKAQTGIEQLKQYAALDNASHLLNKLGIIGDFIGLSLIAGEANAAYANGDTAGAQQIIKNGMLDYVGGLAGGLAAAELVGSALLPLCAAGPAGAIVAGGLTLVAGVIGGMSGELVAHQLADSFVAAQTYVAPPPPPRHDPLILDLDGNGIQTSGINTASPIMFDQNADGVKTATGWVNANDGFLVWDRNGNGMIDNGRELFGDATVKADGTLATNGFNALADLDVNHDGIVNAQDSDFANLKIWRDINQDGTSQSNELFNLDTYQIVGIKLANTVVNTAQGNGNTLTETGSYLHSNGATALAGDMNLANNTFYSQFTDALPLSAEIQALPNIQGAGMVRDLRDAAGRSPQLAATLSQYAAATSDIQKAMLDTLFSQWLATSTFTTTADRAATVINGSSHTTVTLQSIAAGTPAYTAFMDKLSLVEKFNGRTFQPLPSDPTTTLSFTILSAQQALIDQSYQALKNSVYDNLLLQTRLKPYLDALTLDINDNGIIIDASGVNAVLDTLSLTDAKAALLDLLELNRVEGQKLKSMGWSGVNIDKLIEYAGKVNLDSQLQTELNNWHIRIGNGTVTAVAGDTYIFGQSGDDILNVPSSGNNIISGGAGNDTVTASGTNTIYGGSGNDVVNASGSSTVYGGDGNDTVTVYYMGTNRLEGGAGDDLLKVTHNAATGLDAGYYGESTLFIGGAGNDRMEGSSGADTYQFNRGDGMDTILDIGSNANASSGWGIYIKPDAIQFGAGITANDLSISRAGNNLVLKINDPGNASATDQITVENWFASAIYQIENVKFADGNSLSAAQLTTVGNTLYGTNGADTITGTADNNLIYGLAGDDTITDPGGINTIYADDGNDTVTASGTNTIYGGNGNDVVNASGSSTVYGGDGNDTVTVYYMGTNRLEGGVGDDLLKVTHNAAAGLDAGYYGESTLFIGGAGNDRMEGSSGADTYQFNRGDGMDTILDIGSNAAGAGNSSWNNYIKPDAIQFGAGITSNDLSISRSGNNLVLKINDPGNATATDQITVENWWSGDIYRIETFTFTNGTSLTKAQLTPMVGTSGNDNIIGTDYSDTLAGLDGNDVLNGNAGNDILQGGNGNDTLNDTGGANLLDGGMGADTFTGGAGNELFAGGAGNDVINTGDGADVVVFNRNDGQDILNGGVGTDNTLSLGGGIQYSDIALSKSGNDLILELGNADQITLSGWYDTVANHKSVLNLQVVTDAMTGFDRTSSDPLLNKSIQNFNFTAIVNAFDQANGGSANFMHWSAANSLLSAHLSAGDSEALGGDLAYWYGKSGNFSGFSQTAAQDVLNDASFGFNPQALHALSATGWLN